MKTSDIPFNYQIDSRFPDSLWVLNPFLAAVKARQDPKNVLSYEKLDKLILAYEKKFQI